MPRRQHQAHRAADDRALAWVWRHVADYGGDPHRITLLGHSARRAPGGHAQLLQTGSWSGVTCLGAWCARRCRCPGLHELETAAKTAIPGGDLQLSVPRPGRPRLLRPAPSPQVLLRAVCGADEGRGYRRQNRLIPALPGASVPAPVCEGLPGCNHFTVIHELANRGRPCINACCGCWACAGWMPCAECVAQASLGVPGQEVPSHTLAASPREAEAQAQQDEGAKAPPPGFGLASCRMMKTMYSIEGPDPKVRAELGVGFGAPHGRSLRWRTRSR